jgi:hypothetical protein
VLFVVLLTLAGCGGASIAEVSGMVKVDGAPMPKGAILFTPLDGKGQTAGGTIEDGHYSVQVPVAAMKVSLSQMKFLRTRKLYDKPGSPEYTQNTEGLPPRYNEKSELRLDVKPGRNQKDWDVQSK